LATNLVTFAPSTAKVGEASIGIADSGRVAEWFKAPVLKTGRGFRSLVGSNPTPSATLALDNGLQSAVGLAAAQLEEAPALLGARWGYYSGGHPPLPFPLWCSPNDLHVKQNQHAGQAGQQDNKLPFRQWSGARLSIQLIDC
jgi:hypothetical protein